MSSSTSSSRHGALFTVVCALLILLPAILLVNAFTSYTESKAGDMFGVQRIRSVVNSLEYIAGQPDAKILFVGSSLVKDGFSPRLFNQALQQTSGLEVSSFNLGMGNMKPSYQKLLMQRIADAFVRSQARAELVVLEFNPFLSTEARDQFRPFMSEQIQSLLMSDEEVLAELWQDPERFARLASIKYLRNGISAEAITGGLRFLVSQAQAQAPLVDQLTEDQLSHLKELSTLRRQLSQQIAAQYPETKKSHVWNPQTGGGLVDMGDLDESTQALLETVSEKMRHPRALEMDLKSRQNCCDITQLNFSERLIEDFLQTVRIAKTFSDRVEIVLMPRNQQWVKLDAQAEQQLQQTIDLIAEQEQVVIRNYQKHKNFDEKSFYDVTHLSTDVGRPRFSALLAQDLAQYFHGI